MADIKSIEDPKSKHVQIKEPTAEDIKVIPEDTQAPDEENLTAFEVKERKRRTVFVGNVPVDSKPKDISKLFKEYGPIEKIWFRSVATTMETKKPKSAQVKTKDYGA